MDIIWNWVRESWLDGWLLGADESESSVVLFISYNNIFIAHLKVDA